MIPVDPVVDRCPVGICLNVPLRTVEAPVTAVWTSFCLRICCDLGRSEIVVLRPSSRMRRHMLRYAERIDLRK